MNAQVEVTEHSRLQYFPVAFFSSVMGLCGLAMALQQGEAILSLPRGGGNIAAIVSLAYSYGWRGCMH